MIKLKDVNFGYSPYSPVMGQMTMQIALEGDDKPYLNPDDIETSVKEVLDDLKNKIDEKNLSTAWGDAMCAKCWLWFTGDEIMNKANIDASEYFFFAISHISHELQKEMREAFHGKEESVEFHLTPPRMVFFGKPLYETGYRGMVDQDGNPNDLYGITSWYENFQVILIDASDDIQIRNPMALMEMQRHSNFQVICKCKTKEDVSTFINSWIDGGVQIPLERCTIVSNDKEVIEAAFNEGVRASTTLPDCDFVLKV